MRKTMFRTLYPRECLFLKKVYENFICDLDIKDTTVQIVGLERREKAEPELMLTLGENENLSENLLSLPRISALIERVDGGAKIYADVFVLNKETVQKYVSLAKGLAIALALFRGTKESFTVSILSQGVKAIENLSETQVIMSAVSKWMNDDEEYCFWKKNSDPYLGWFFEEPDFKNMGRDVTTAVCNAIERCAESQGDRGNYKLLIAPCGELTREAFGAVSECVWFETKIVGKLNSEAQIYFSSGERAELKFELMDIDEDGKIIEHVIDFTLTLETGYQEETDVLLYKVEVVKEMIRFLDVWQTVKERQGYEFKISEKRSSF